MRRGLPLLLSFLVLSIAIGMFVGSVGISPVDVFKDQRKAFIVLEIRLPRILMASTAGAVLAVVGASFQVVLKNPLVDPYLMGTSAGASFGAVLTEVLAENLGPFWLGLEPIVAFVFALFSATLVILLSRRGGALPVTELVLTGVVIGMIFNSGLIILEYFFRRSVQGISTWIFGSLSGVVWRDLPTTVLALSVVLSVTMPLSFRLDALSFGEDFARVSGVNVEHVKMVVVITGVLGTSLVVSKVGSIGFVGLVTPHLVRIIAGSRQRVVLPMSAIFGAAFLNLTDTLARSVVPPLEIPVGVVTSLIGVPIFVALMRRRGARW